MPVTPSIATDDFLVLNVRGGARLCVPAFIDQITTYVLLEQEDWFEDEIRFVRRWLKPGMRAVDVGANLGVFTVAIAQAVTKEGRVWAFEPTPRTADYLEKSLALNGCTQTLLVRAAVSERAGSISFASTANPEINAVGTARAGGQTITVPAVTLDQTAAEHRWEGVDFIKLDVEGHEREVVRGAREFLRSASPLVMFEIKAGDRVDLGMLEPLAEMGYGFYRLLPGPLVLTPLFAGEALDGYQLNLFACKPDRAAELSEAGFIADPGAVELSAPAKDAWARYLASAPYAAQLREKWPAKAGLFAAADQTTYFRGLSAFAESRDAGKSAAERCAWLAHALECVGEARSMRDSLPRTVSFARLAIALGERAAASNALQSAVVGLGKDAGQGLAEPLLAPDERYERVATGDRPLEWLHCGVVEAFEKCRSFSSRFSGDSSLPLLEPILSLPFRSPEMDRRWQLVRMLAGLQEGIEPRPPLCTPSDENLNPEYWCR